MHQMNRKPLSHEQSKAAQLKEKVSVSVESNADDTARSEEVSDQIELSQEEQAKKHFDSAVDDWTKEQMSKNGGVYVPPTDEELLKLAGGNKMMANTGDEGLELRSVLAQRVSSIM